MGNLVMSLTINSRTLKTGLSMAHWSAAPRATASSLFSVLLVSRFKKSPSFFCALRRRDPPPISSIDANCSVGMPEKLS